jgi:hypothetical protein
MQLVIHIPDEMIEPVRHRLPPPEVGLLEAIALDAVLGALTRLAAPEMDRKPDA